MVSYYNTTKVYTILEFSKSASIKYCNQRSAAKRSKGSAFAKQQYASFVAVSGMLGNVFIQIK